ncbi:hypothetical protein MYX82_03995 [Acidobacteria bacterium AH-259-D05]|nr:hypothetical protein [Acidobacteria bacterium AH-259-D05]
MNKKILFLTVLAATAVLYFSLEQGPLKAIAAAVPEPRSPLVPRITSVDQLLPFARIIVQRDYIGQRLGWGVRGGERVLYETSTRVHPWVREAFVRALKELGCTVDVVVHDGPPTDHREWAKEVIAKMKERLSLDFNKKPEKRYGFGSSGGPRTPPPGVSISAEEARYYDVVIGSRNIRSPGLGGANAWATPELLASVGTVYPGEIMDLIDAKTWAIIRNAERVEISDAQGSQASFTWFPEWWEIMEGTHPKIRVPGYGSTFGTLRPGRSEFADFAGHLAAVPRYGAVEQSDFTGKLEGTLGQPQQVPKMTLWHDRGGIVKIEGGSYYGDMWREALELTKDIQYPGYPRPGTGWIMEFGLGTNPKIIGPVEVEELKGVPGRDLMEIRWSFARDRAGAIHAGYGTLGASWWGTLMDMPVNHYHLHLKFVTYIVHTRDGKTVKLLDQGYLTVLDDPDVRALAAKYGDPDKMLSLDWVPVLAPDGSLKPPKGKLVPYEEFIASMPFKLDDPRLVYRIPQQLKDFYGEERMRYYTPQEFLEFYRKLGQVPVKRVKVN